MTSAAQYNPIEFDRPRRNIDRQQEIAQQLQLLRSRDPRQRADAARRLGQLAAEPAALVGALEDPNSFVRSAAAEALGYAAGEQRDEIADILMTVIDDPNPHVTGAAIRSLGRLQAHEARDQIVPCLDDPNPVIVSASLSALGLLGASDLAEQLATFLDSDNFYIRLAAARAVGLLGYDPAGPRLLELLEESLQQRKDRPDSKLPQVIIEALARLQVKESIPQLIEIAQHEVGLRSMAIQSLVALDAEAAIPQLAHMLADPGGTLRETLIRTMIQTDYRKALPAIRPLLKDAKTPVRQAALAAVTAWHDAAAVEHVRWICYHDPSSHLRPRAVYTLAALLGEQALPDLLKLAGDLNSVVRRAVARSLGQITSLAPQAVAALQRLAADEDERVAESARDALEAHSLTPAQPEPEPRFSVPIPEELPAQYPWLAQALEGWQAGLAQLIGRSEPDQLTAIDQALTTLLVTLRDGQRSPDTP